MPQAAQPWNRTGEEKREYVRRMFAEISPTYDFVNSAMSLRLHHRWRAQAVSLLDLKTGQVAADLCCGTGDFLPPLRKALSGNRVLGVDFCQPMLKKARSKGANSLSLGDACRLPVRTESCDAVTIGWGLRNVQDLPLSLKEALRILKPGGKFVSIDMAVPKSGFIRVTGGFVLHKIVPLVGGLFGMKDAYTYLPKSTERFTAREELARMMGDAGFKKVQWRDKFFGNICIHWGEK